MDNGLIFPCRPSCDKDIEGVTGKARPAEPVAGPCKPVGGAPGKSGAHKPREVMPRRIRV